MNHATILMVAPGDISIEVDAEGNPRNPRGPVTDTTDLQASIKEIGRIVEPLLVYRNPDGTYTVAKGHRRLTAARIMNLAAVPCIVIERDPALNLLDVMLSDFVHQSFPPIVLNGKGGVVGGVAKAVASRLATGDRTMESLARLMGVRPDVVSALNQLNYAPLAVKKAVADGRLSLTAFARMKHAPEDVQTRIVEDEDDVTVSRVREALREAKAEDAQATGEEEGPPLLEQLNDVLAFLRWAAGTELGPREAYVWGQIQEVVNHE